MPEPSFDDRPFSERVAARDLNVGVVGLGYVGLPLAVAYAEAGFRTIGFDVDAERAAALNQGHSHIDDVSRERGAAVVTARRFSATADESGLADADVLFLCVPTPAPLSRSSRPSSRSGGCGRAATSPWRSRPSGWTPATRPGPSTTLPRSSAGSPRRAPNGPAPCSRRSWTDRAWSTSSPRRRRPRWRSCSRT